MGDAELRRDNDTSDGQPVEEERSGRHNSDVSVVSHTISTVGLCMCTLVQAYLLISVFPYAGYMVMTLMGGINEENAGTYAGLIASSFMAGRTLSAYGWGVVADMYGRKFVLIVSLLLSACFSMLFGTSKSFFYAMIWRFCLGLSGGIISTAKTAVTELAHGSERLERRAMGLVIGMRGWGFLISPGIGGILAEPLQQYPNAEWLYRGGVFNSLLARFPFLLPNLVGAVLCLLAAVIVTLFIDETLPDSKLRSSKQILSDFYQYARQRAVHVCSFLPRARHEESQSLLPRGATEVINGSVSGNATNGNCNANGLGEIPLVEESLWERKNTRKHFLAYCMFSFFVVAIDEAFPLFCMSRGGGLGIPEATIGKILSGAGLLFASCQYATYAAIVHHFGLYPSIAIGSTMGVVPVLFFPLSLVVNKGVSSGISLSTYFFLSITMGISKIFSCLFFTSISIALNKTVPSSQRATMNGLVTVLGSIAKGAGPTFAGALVAFSLSSGFVPSQYGSIVIFGVIALLGFSVAGEVLVLNGEVNPQNEEDSKATQTP